MEVMGFRVARICTIKTRLGKMRNPLKGEHEFC